MKKITERPLFIPFAELFDSPKTFSRNVLIFKLWNEGWLQKDIAKRTRTRQVNVSHILRYYTNSTYRKEIQEKANKHYHLDIEKNRESRRKYASEHKEDARKRSIKFYERNPDYESRPHRKKFRSEWKKENKERVNITVRRRRALIKKGFQGYVPDNLIKLLMEKQKELCVLCGDILTYKIEVDHIIPVTSERTIECICNFQLTHSICNRSKLGKILPEYEELNELSLQLDAIRKGEIDA